MDELHQLRERHDTLPDPSPRSVAEARARLTAHMSKPAPRRARTARRLPVRPLWGIGLVGAAAAAVLITSTVGDPGPRPTTPHAPVSTLPHELRLRTVANARDLADNAAAMAAAEGDTTPAPNQWVYMKKLIAQTRTDGGEWPSGWPKKTATHEMWRKADDKQFASIEDGELKIIKGSEFEVTYSFLLSLPTEPDALLARVNEQIEAEARQREGYKKPKPKFGDERRAEETRGPAISAEERRMWAFQNIAQGMRDAALPSKLRAAMYGAMSRIPGVKYEARASDLARRNGVTLYRDHNGYLRDEIFIDPETYAYLGYRTIAVRDHDQDKDFFAVKKGQIIGWDALLKTAVVEEPGNRS
ncbi:CU044_5270 family protein [Microtetraspora malaysiensis]|uniref:CU044_5270 family protein n=1 Tax=Microtetraspora malaysiensis TaxID=161358 RepID=UPI003D94BB82